MAGFVHAQRTGRLAGSLKLLNFVGPACMLRLSAPAADGPHRVIPPPHRTLRTRCAHAAGGDEGYELYEARLRAACGPYRSVVFIGDSMGATGALLFAHLATEVHAWTPQIDLATSSIRRGMGEGAGFGVWG